MAKWQSVAVVFAVAFLAGSSSATGAQRTYSATVHLGSGRQSRSFRLHEPAGTIQLYRISAPRGADVRGVVQIPRVTAALRIATGPTALNGSCAERGSRVTCTVGEEGCPMPEATWDVHLNKRAGPAGDVTLWFRVGQA
jgi:hypothetical protein